MDLKRQDPNPSALLLPNYPYLNKFSPEQVRDALERKDKLVELMMDPVGPDGTLISIPPDLLHILAFHLAYAGADAHTDDRQLITATARTDESQMFEIYEWAPRGENQEPAPVDTTTAEAAELADAMRVKLDPQVRAKLIDILLQEGNKR